ncbi:TonB-dependent receptor [Rurimicrobium arvi]|uniref:TonB-dependent receptor n=1 Tax=Rurimicrobium arvi TaxID=2049916 RepID=A0ABP8MP66_9BACT
MQVSAREHCTFHLSLELKEQHTNTPLDLIEISLVAITDSTRRLQAFTDENGRCTFELLCAGAYRVELHSLAYEDSVLQVNPEKDSSLTIKLAHTHQSLHNVTVIGKKTDELLLPKDQLSADENNAHLGTDISSRLKTLAGVNTLANGANISKPVIHGLHSNRILMLNNGVRQEDQQWGTEHAPNMDPYENTLTVLKGAAGVRYGTDAIGGVILSEPRPIRSGSGWGGDLSMGAYSNNRMGTIAGMLEHRFRKHPEFAFRLQSSARQGGNYQLPGDYWVANSGIRELNYSGSFQYRGAHTVADLYYSHFGNTTGIYRGTHTGSQGDLLAAIASDTPLIYSGFSYKIDRPRQQVSHDLLKLKVSHDTKQGTFSLIYSLQHNFRQEYDVVRIDNGNAQLNLTLNTQHLNLHWEHKDGAGLRGETGVEAQYQHNYFRQGDRVFIPTYYGYATSAYAIERWEKERLSLEAGVRFDYKHFDTYNPQGNTLQNVRYLLDYKNPSATVAARYKISGNLSALLTLSNAWRAPQASELFSAGLHQGGARIELGDKNLKPENAYNSSANLVWQTKGLRVDAEVYAQRINNFIYLSPSGSVLTIRGYYNTFTYMQTDAFLRGADITAHYDAGIHWRFEGKASVLRARDISKNDWLILMPSDRFSGSIRYERSLNDHFRDCFAALNGQYVSKQIHIPANFSDLDNLMPPDAYFLLGAEAGTTCTIRKRSINISLSVSNLLNRNYRDYMDVFRYFLNQQGRNFAVNLRVPFS